MVINARLIQGTLQCIILCRMPTIDPPSDHFYSSKTGIRVNLGTSKRRSQEPHCADAKLLYHDITTNDYGPTDAFKSKFITKRRASNISNVFSDQQREYAKVKEAKVLQLTLARKEKLKSLERSHGYNVITGEVLDESVMKEERSSRTHLNFGVGSETSKRGEILLRDNDSRFYRVSSQTATSEERLRLQVTQGLLKAHKTSSLPGRFDMESFGVEDQFSKSMYQPRSEEAQKGLVETRRLHGAYPKRDSVSSAMTQGTTGGGLW